MNNPLYRLNLSEKNVNVLGEAYLDEQGQPMCADHRLPLRQYKRAPWGWGCRRKRFQDSDEWCESQIWFNDRAL